MSVTIPLYFQPQDITACTVTPQTPASTGVLTGGTSIDLHALGLFGGFSYEPTTGLVQLQATDAVIDNYQVSTNGFRCSVSEIVKGGFNSLLFDTFALYDIVRIAITAAGAYGGSAGKTLVAIGVVESCPAPRGPAPAIVTLSILPCGVDAQWLASPTI